MLHETKNIELPLGWLDIFFLSIFCASVLFRGGAFSFSAAGISRRTGIGGVLIQTVLFFLVAIGVDQKTAEQDACRIEHDISQQTYDAMCAHAQREADQGVAGFDTMNEK